MTYHLVPFASWGAVLAYVKANRPVWYHAPLDRYPTRVSCKASRKRIKVNPMSREADPFYADAGHLDRFRGDA